ncbi:MAG TPA: HesA/MoeB/ThiF family protein [Candidatus Cryosericum sp.]
MTASPRRHATTSGDPVSHRYERQVWMKQIGEPGQRRLQQTSALVVGAGGLGSPILSCLAGAGVGTIGVIDGDIVDLTNLNRQFLYTTADIGQPKALAARDRLVSLNPEIRIEAYPTRLNADIAYELMSAYSLVVDASDNYETRYLISDACVLFGKPLFIGAVSGFHGMALTVLPRKTACFRCLYPEPPSASMERQERARGIVGTTPAVIGSIVAQNVIKYIVQTGDWMAGKLLLMDGEGNRFDTVPLDRNAACPACGDHPTITELVPLRQRSGQTSC